jgi:hypothetical protein
LNPALFIYIWKKITQTDLMKKFKLVSAVFILFAAFNFASCSSDVEPIDPAIVIPDPEDPENPENPIQTGNFHVDFDSQTYIATDVDVTLANGVLTINAIKGTPPNIASFAMLVSVTPGVTGTYQANDNLLAYQTISGSTITQFVGMNPDNLNADTGSITITEIDMTTHKISGTFHFVGYAEDNQGNLTGTKEFTNGVFDDLTFTSTTTPVVPSDDTFYAKVEGVEFVEDQIDVAEITQDPPVAPLQPYISIAGSKVNDDAVLLGVHYNLTPGTYPITGIFSETDVVTGKCVIDGVLYGATSGSVTVISNNGTRIKGTFQFDAPNFEGTVTKHVTGGTFDVELP